MNGPAAYRPTLSDVRGVRKLEISEKSLAARRPHGTVRAATTLGGANRGRKLDGDEIAAIEAAMRQTGRL